MVCENSVGFRDITPPPNTHTHTHTHTLTERVIELPRLKEDIKIQIDRE